MRRSVVLLSGAIALLCTGCGGSIAGSPVPAPAMSTPAAPTTVAPRTTAAPATALADPDGTFYTATVPAGLVNATTLVTWTGENHAVLTPDTNPRDNKNYITIRTDPVLEGDADTIARKLKNPGIILKDPPPMAYSRQTIDGRLSVVQDIGPGKVPDNPASTFRLRVYYIPNKDGRGRPVVVRCRWTDTDKAVATTIESGCAALVEHFDLK